MFSVNTYKYGATVKELKSTKSPLVQLLKKFPDRKWNYEFLSCNPNITWDFIQQNRHLTGSTGSAGLTWDMDWLVANSCVTREMIFSDREKWGKCLYLAENPNLSMDDIKELFPVIHGGHPVGLSRNPNLTWEFIRNNPDYTWNLVALGKNSNLSLEQGLPEPELKGITLSQFISHFLRNPNTTWELFKRLQHLCTNPDWGFHLSQNPNITWEIVQANPDIKWHYSNLAENPNIPSGKFPEVWNSRNPNITYRTVRKLMEKYGYGIDCTLERNLFLHDPGMFNRVTRNRTFMRKYAVENM